MAFMGFILFTSTKVTVSIPLPVLVPPIDRNKLASLHFECARRVSTPSYTKPFLSTGPMAHQLWLNAATKRLSMEWRQF